MGITAQIYAATGRLGDVEAQLRAVFPGDLGALVGEDRVEGEATSALEQIEGGARLVMWQDGDYVCWVETGLCLADDVPLAALSKQLGTVLVGLIGDHGGVYAFQLFRGGRLVRAIDSEGRSEGPAISEELGCDGDGFDEDELARIWSRFGLGDYFEGAPPYRALVAGSVRAPGPIVPRPNAAATRRSKPRTVELVEHRFAVKFERFAKPTPRTIVSRSPCGSGCVLIAMRGDGAVSVRELTLDGREPPESPLLRPRNPGTFAATLIGARAWVAFDGTLHTLCLRTWQWDAVAPVPQGSPSARLISVGEDEVLLCSATTELRTLVRARRSSDGEIRFGAGFASPTPTIVVPGEPELWGIGTAGRCELRDSSGTVLECRDVPRFTQPIASGHDIFAIGSSDRGVRSAELVVIGTQIRTATHWPCEIFGLDSAGRLALSTDRSAARRSDQPSPLDANRIELVDLATLRSLGGHRVRGYLNASCGPDAVVTIGDTSLDVIVWDEIVPTPRLVGAKLLT